jgi:hypothetical protein
MGWKLLSLCTLMWMMVLSLWWDGIPTGILPLAVRFVEGWILALMTNAFVWRPIFGNPTAEPVAAGQESPS